MRAMMFHVQIGKQGRVKFPSNTDLPQGEADVIFLFPEGKVHGQISKFAGCISNKEAHELMTIVKEDCERIEQSGW